MNPMMKTLLEELTQVRDRQARPVLPAGGTGALPERPCDSELSLPKGRVGQTLSRQSLTFQGQES